MARLFTARELGIELGPNSPLRGNQRRAPRDLEHPEQAAVVRWAKENEKHHPDLRWLFAVPNFSGFVGSPGARMRSAARLNAEGRKKGVLDLWLTVRRAAYPGMVIEMKAGNGKPTKEQREWIEHLRSQGWYVVVCYSATDAIAELTKYLRLAA